MYTKTLGAAALAVALFMVMAGAAIADDFKVDLDAVPTSTSINVGGSTTAQYLLTAQKDAGEPTTGAATCNASVGTPVAVTISSDIAGLTISPSSFNMTGCGGSNAVIVSFTGNSAGTYNLSATATGGSGAALTSNQAAWSLVVQSPLTAPVLSLPANISTLATGASGANVSYTASASDENGAVAINCSPASGSLFAPGTTTVNCSATNAAGTTNGSFTVTVSFGFIGFGQPVDGGILNIAKAGQAIPLKFQVTGDGGAGIEGLTAPPVQVKVANLSCGLNTTTDQVEEYAAGASGLQDLGGGYYQFNWKTPKEYAGSCKRMSVNLGDSDPSHTADFKFSK